MIKFIKRNYGYMFFSFFIVSFICWIVEFLYNAVIRNTVVFPGAMLGPWLPIYGSTFLLLILFIRKKDNIIITAIKTFCIASIVEYISSFISEKVFNHIIWDYSDSFMNLNGRICLEMSLLFMIFGLFFIYVIDPYLRRLYLKFKYVKAFNITLTVLFIMDIIVNSIWI